MDRDDAFDALFFAPRGRGGASEGWTGRLLLLLDEPDRVQTVTLHRRDGTVADYPPADLAD
ncbi:hypothetical protein BH10ACT10_BH10ACT10_06090 [soil metagenome]